MSICETFRNLSLKTWLLLGDGRAVGHQIGEETITDINLLELKKRHPMEIVVKGFSKPEEGKIGADWEWWFTGTSGRWFGMRVQAKIINFRTDSFPHLHYRRNKGSRYQSDLLIDRALLSNPPLVPVYCLYSNWPQSIFGQMSRWGISSLCWEFLGCFLVSAFAVIELRRQGSKRHILDLQPYMHPWHYLVCCTDANHPFENDLPSRAAKYFRNVWLSSELSLIDGLSNDKRFKNIRELLGRFSEYWPTGVAPQYVHELIETSGIEERPDTNLCGVVVFNERPRPMWCADRDMSIEPRS